MARAKLFVIAGPTAVGKTDMTINIAQHLHTEIISADSRQVFKEMKIGTASPTVEQLSMVPHHLVGHRSIFDNYNAFEYEQEALKAVLDVTSRCGGIAILTGGSMMYIDALCEGIDEVPTISEEVRAAVMAEYELNGIEYMKARLQQLDAKYYAEADLQNPRRVLHAIEVCLQSGTTYSSFRSNRAKERPFDVVRIAINRPREELFDRINHRAHDMIEQGLVDEAKQLIHSRNLTALNTVGYKEIFSYLDGTITLAEAERQIARNTRHYAKRQLQWFRLRNTYAWFDANDENAVMSYIYECYKN